MGDILEIVWYKRDLRVEDHAPLARAAASGAVIPLYILEPELWRQPDMSRRHYEFLGECLSELDADLVALGQPLVVVWHRLLEPVEGGQPAQGGGRRGGA